MKHPSRDSTNSLQHRPSTLRLPSGQKLGERALDAALNALFRGLQPETRERFATTPDEGRLRRLYFRASDGWRAPLFALPAPTNGGGEPVILAHGLGVNHHSLQLQRERSLAWALHRAGFQVYLLTHRGDQCAIAPPDGSGDFDFDHIVEQDVPASIEAVLEDSGFPRLLWVGHGLGGQLLYGHLAQEGTHSVAAATAICAATSFEAATTAARTRQLALSLLPEGLRLPLGAVATLAAPALRSGSAHMKRSEGPDARGIYRYATESLHGGLLQQVNRWLNEGYLSDRSGSRDLVAALSSMELPLQIVHSEGDSLCTPEAAKRPLEYLAGPRDLHTLPRGWGHLDPLIGRDAESEVHPRVVEWLERHRSSTWESEWPEVVAGDVDATTVRR